MRPAASGRSTSNTSSMTTAFSPHPLIDGPFGSIPPALGSLDQLERLDLKGNFLYGPIPAELGNLDQRKGLDLSDNFLDGEGPRSW